MGYSTEFNGEIKWRGDDWDDNGWVIVKNNKLTIEYKG